jgi:hypothetical protein
MTPENRDDRGARRRRLIDRWTTPAEQWRVNVQRWVDAGIVTQVQGDEILSMQRSEAPVDPSPPDVLSRSQEFLSYCVLLVIAMSAILFLNHYWASIGRSGHLSVALLVATDALIVGSTIVALGGGGARRLGGLLWLIATVGVATSASDVMGPGAQQHPGLRLLVVGLTVLLTSVLLWRNQNRPLQFLSAVTGFILTLSGIATMGRVHATPTQLALFIWLCALAIGLASLQMIRPALTALVVAEVGCCVGALSLSFPHHLGGVVLGIVTTVLAVALGVVLERPLVIVTGALGFFMFDIRAFSIYLKSSNAALGAGVLGLIIVCVGLWHAAHTVVRERRGARSCVQTTVDNEMLASS